MDTLRTTAFYLTAWHTFLAALATLLLIVTNDVEPATACLIAANLALLFSLALIARASLLNERRIVRGEFWRAVPPRARPQGEAGLRMARLALEETLLRFAKGAAAAAIVLSALAYASHGVTPAASAQAAHAYGVTQPEPGGVTAGTAYGLRLLPTN